VPRSTRYASRGKRDILCPRTLCLLCPYAESMPRSTRYASGDAFSVNGRVFGALFCGAAQDTLYNDLYNVKIQVRERSATRIQAMLRGSILRIHVARRKLMEEAMQRQRINGTISQKSFVKETYYRSNRKRPRYTDSSASTALFRKRSLLKETY